MVRNEPQNESEAEGESPATRDAPRAPGWIATLQRNPAFTALFAICISAGALAGFFYLPDDFSLVRRLLGGAVGGGGIAFLMTATKML